MKQKLLLKVMLLLCALVAGSSSSWADETATLTNAEIVAAGDAASGYSTYAITGGGGKTWNVYAIKNYHSKATNDKYFLQLKKYANSTASYIQVPVYGTKITSITMTVSSTNTTINGGGNTATLYFSASNSTSATGTGVASGTGSSSVTIDCSDLDLNTGYITVSGGVRVWDVEVTYTNAAATKVSTPSIKGDTPFLNSTEVSITCGTDGAAIQYSLDNGSSWTNYTTPFTLTETKTVKAKATKSGLTDSDVASKDFTKVTPMTVAEALEAIDALADNGTIDDQYVTGIISQIDGYNSTYKSITYWISVDGTTTSQLEVYSGKGIKGADFSAQTDLTVGDIVVVNGTLKKYVSGSTTTPEFNSNSQLFDYTPKVKAPTFSPAAGAVAVNTTVTISTTTEGATIYYTTDGTNPTTTSSVYSAAITIDAAKTIKAFAVKDGHPDSDIATAAYTIAEPCATPTFSPAAGEVAKGTTVTISTETDGATIYYTTNGSEPTTSSNTYSSAISINSAMTLKAIAVKDGMANSEVATAAYTVRDYVTLPFNWAGGTSGNLTGQSGVTGNSLGDYAEGNAPYRTQMNAVGDYIQIKTNARPGRVTVGVKMIGGSTTSKIKVQESTDGSTFTDIEEFTISGKQNDILNLATTKAFNTASRYVRINKSVHANGGNIGIGPISIAEYTDVSKEINSTYSTLTSDYALDFTNVYGMTAYIVKDNDASDGYVTLTQVNKVPANTGLILKVNSTGYPYSIPVLIGDAGDVSGNKLAGSATEETAIEANGGYILKNGAFHPANAGNLPAGKAYLNIAVSAGAPVLNLHFDGETTGINDVRAKIADVSGNIYDLQGRKVAQPSKGLYIVNGKKVVIK